MERTITPSSRCPRYAKTIGDDSAADEQNGPGLREFPGEAVPTRSTKIGSDSKEKTSSLVIRYH